MNQCYYDFVLECVRQLPLEGPMLNVGCRIVAGQEKWDLRQIPELRNMIGLDMEYDASVDVKADAENLPYPDKHFGVVMCLSALEHMRDPWRCVKEMCRVVKDNGFVILAAPMMFPYHACPVDYWRFTRDGLWELLKKGMYDIRSATAGPGNYYHTSVAVGTRSGKGMISLDLSRWSARHKNQKPWWRDALWTLRKRWL